MVNRLFEVALAVVALTIFEDMVNMILDRVRMGVG
jgi:hypothetical protein